MPLAAFTSTPIEIPVSDRVINNTRIKQKATFLSLYHSQDNGQSRASIDVLVRMYGSDKKQYGQELAGPGFSAYRVTLTADNNTIVDAMTGEIKAIRQFEMDLEWKAKADLMEDVVMYQGDFFEALREHPIKIGDMIRQNIAQADTMGKFQ